MKRSVLIVMVGILSLSVLVVWLKYLDMSRQNVTSLESEGVQETIRDDSVASVEEEVTPTLTVPMARADERVTKKPFGILIEPKTSPIQPERFRGYHTGVDFEIFPEERLIDVPVLAVCEGMIVEKRRATGYGGVLVTNCVVEGKQVTIVYGHLRLSSIEKNKGQSVERGEVLGVLGTGGTPETDGERKHLHLGIHLGSVVNIVGYVDSVERLSDWLDP